MQNDSTVSNSRENSQNKEKHNITTPCKEKEKLERTIEEVSTLGNPVTPDNVQRARISNMMPMRIARSSASSMTESTLNSRMSAIEQRIELMEETITQSVERSMAKIIEKMSPANSPPITSQPPGGEVAGWSHE